MSPEERPLEPDDPRWLEVPHDYFPDVDDPDDEDEATRLEGLERALSDQEFDRMVGLDDDQP